jgi:hypothetical protein
MKWTTKDYAFAAGYIAFVWITANILIRIILIVLMPDEEGMNGWVRPFNNSDINFWVAAVPATVATVWWIWFRRN